LIPLNNNEGDKLLALINVTHVRSYRKFIVNVMQAILLEIVALITAIFLPMFIYSKLAKRKRSKTAKYTIDTDTSEARYAINENGFLEEINAGKLFKYRH